MHLQEIRKYWPDAKFIHVIRDVRDVYTSWKINKKGDLNSFITKANSILSYLNNSPSTSENYVEVRYEDLVSNPAKELKTLLRFLGEPYEANMADYQGDSTDFDKVKRITGKISPTTRSLSKPIFRSSVSQWKEHLSKDELLELNIGLKDYTARFS